MERAIKEKDHLIRLQKGELQYQLKQVLQLKTELADKNKGTDNMTLEQIPESLVQSEVVELRSKLERLQKENTALKQKNVSLKRDLKEIKNKPDKKKKRKKRKTALASSNPSVEPAPEPVPETVPEPTPSEPNALLLLKVQNALLFRDVNSESIPNISPIPSSEQVLEDSYSSSSSEQGSQPFKSHHKHQRHHHRHHKLKDSNKKLKENDDDISQKLKETEDVISQMRHDYELLQQQVEVYELLQSSVYSCSSEFNSNFVPSSVDVLVHSIHAWNDKENADGQELFKKITEALYTVASKVSCD